MPTATPTVKTLATRHDNIAPQRNFGGVLPAWNQLSPGDGTYAALYPFGWTTYKVFQSDVSMRFWSPIVAGEDERTSMPVAFFDVNAGQPHQQGDRPLGDVHVPERHLAPDGHDTRRASTASSTLTRFGCQRRDAGLGQPDEHARRRTSRSGPSPHCPTADQKLTYATSWNGAGDGSDIYGPFTSTGELPNGAIDELELGRRRRRRRCSLRPGQKTTVRFALSWDFPQVYYGSSRDAGAGRLDASVHGVPRRRPRRPPTTTSPTRIRSSRPSTSPSAS